MANSINLGGLTADQLRRAATIKEQIQNLEQELTNIFSGNVARRGRPPGTGRPGRPPGSKNAKPKRVLSPEARASIVAAQKRRWAKFKAGKK